MNQLDGLKPEKVFRYFAEIAAIPHGSRNTKAISDYLADFARARGLEYYQDASNNIVMIAEASAGYGDAEPLILQGHMDMVCEKEAGCAVDFEKDGLELYADGDFLRARGTTLGGDDGIAVAYALAILDSAEILHPRLEVVVTVDEEIGMLGAEAIDLSMLKGHVMLNLDSDVEGHFLTSCAGGMTVQTSLPAEYGDGAGRRVTLTVAGLLGGHSGSEIDKERANANLVMGRVLRTLAKENVKIGLCGLSGGAKDNAIPRECTAELLLADGEETRFEEIVSELGAVLAKEYAASDPGICLKTEFGASDAKKVLTPSSFEKVVFYLRNVPNGVQNKSLALPGLVETSLNLGILNLTDRALLATASVRSSVSSRKAELCERLEFLAEFLGASVAVSGDYPAWEYKEHSPLRDAVCTVYADLFGEKPVFEAIHAGLECGILSAKIKDLDCVSFGPSNYDIHTPNEHLSISSTEKIWKFLVEFLKRWK